MNLYGVRRDLSSISIYKVIKETPKTYTVYLRNSSRAVPVSVVRKATMSTISEKFFYNSAEAVAFLCSNYMSKKEV